MNICFFIGKIISEIEFDFVIGNNKCFENEKISIVRFKVELIDGNIINVIGYNYIADFCYQKLEKDYNVIIEGMIRTEGDIEIGKVKKEK